MATTIRKHLRDFLAVAGLAILALGITYYLIQNQRLRLPILEEKPFQLKAEFESAQAITPGQGQTVVVAGVKIGDISKVELEDGKAVVTMDVERKFLPIYENATALVRPRTGLQDMFVELDPGSKGAGEFDEGGTIPMSNTEPQVNLDQILEALDADTQAYLRALIVGGGQGLKGRARDFGKVLGGLGPINQKLAQINTLVAQRRENLSRLIHNLNILTGTIGDNGDELARLVDSSNAALGAIASQDINVQRTVALLPGTLQTARNTLGKLEGYSATLGPTFNQLRPFARNLDEMNASVRRVADTYPVIRDEIRPFVRAARGPVNDLRPAAKRLAAATPRLTDLALEINRLGNMAAYNPNGAEAPGTPGRAEGYLYWAGWLGHNGTSVFQAADGHGLYRRIYLTSSCQSFLGILEASPLAPVVTPFAQLFAAGGPCA
ncbi:MAG TPA: MlaD family protein [Solirubrobacterales bacterium]|nr:MlaD family protein [Solirubrobacterales bacterium]